MKDQKPFYFKPDGNDLKKVMFYYGIDLDEQIVCPFHNDHNPSCHINFEEGVFHCFACGASGDAFSFVKLANPKIDGLSQLLLYFTILTSKKAGKVKLLKNRASKSKQDKQKQREMNLEIAHDMYFGLKSVDWREVDSNHKDYMLSRGFTNEALNIIKAKPTYTNDNYPIIFPIIDLDTFKGYVLRTTNKKMEGKRKYLYNEGFSRIDTLCGEYRNDVVVLCEGYMDRLKLRQFGLKYVAAIFGWKITQKQVDKLKSQGVKTIINALDLDGPGRKGADILRIHFDDVIDFQFPKYCEDNEGNKIVDDKGNKKILKDPGDLTKKQFVVAYQKTQNIYRRGRRKNVNIKQDQKRR